MTILCTTSRNRRPRSGGLSFEAVDVERGDASPWAYAMVGYMMTSAWDARHGMDRQMIGRVFSPDKGVR